MHELGVEQMTLTTKSAVLTHHFDHGYLPRQKIAVRMERRCAWCSRRLIVFRMAGDLEHEKYYCNATHNRRAGSARKRRRGERDSPRRF